MKGVYQTNAVDRVTQREIAATYERLSETYLVPVIKAMLKGFPFTISGFHADNGSEYINHQVAGRLRTPASLTQSRRRQWNDNGLAETKNGTASAQVFRYNHIRTVIPCKSTPSAPHTSTPTPQLSSDPCLFGDKVKYKGIIQRCVNPTRRRQRPVAGDTTHVEDPSNELAEKGSTCRTSLRGKARGGC